MGEPTLDAETLLPLLRGGKRLRAGLVLYVHETLSFWTGANRDRAIDLACAVELAHVASLIVDDILDEDAERRGQEALHVKYGNKAAMLNAIGLLSLPYDLAGHYSQLYSGWLAETQRRMTSGAFKELWRQKGLSASKLYDVVVTQKTGELFALAAAYGAASIVGAPADTAIVQAFRKYGLHVGKAMQIADDIADIARAARGEGSTVPGSEMLLLRCVTADGLAKELVTDLKEGSPKPSKVKYLWQKEGVQCRLSDLVAGECLLAQAALDRLEIKLLVKDVVTLKTLPGEIAGMMVREGVPE
jgi:hypothetical protein